MKPVLVTFALLLATSKLGAQTLTGQWAIHSQIAGTETDQVCKFFVTSNKIAGTCSANDKDLVVTGTVDQDKVTWQYETESNGTPLTLIYAASFNDPKKFAGTVKVQPYGITGDFTATSGLPSPATGSSPTNSSSTSPSGSSEAPSNTQCAYQKKLDVNSSVLATIQNGLVKPGTHMDMETLSKDPGFAEFAKTMGEQDKARGTQDWAALCNYKAENAAQETKGRPQAVFMGDSITEMWKLADPSLFTSTVLDRGISGQTTSQILLRFYDDVVALNPSVVHLMAGTNDVGQNTGPISDEDILNNIRVMIELAKANHIKVIVASILPMAKVAWKPSITPAARVAALNEQLKAIAMKMGVQYVDYYSLLKDATGGMRPEYSNDGVHPNMNGYAVMRPLAERAIKAAGK